jgi:GDPmannose 4,6-dehydratase
VRKALITGITGQDGYFLSRLLIAKGYRIWGLTTDLNSTRSQKFGSFFPNVTLLSCNLNDYSNLKSIIHTIRPDEVYNLGGASHVGRSFSEPEITIDSAGLGTIRLLDIILKEKLTETRFYQASSSEMFGDSESSPQDESTQFRPNSPYAVAKVMAHNSVLNYREAFSQFAASGILFNHESEYRHYDFVTRKITSNLAKIKLGLIETFSLGSIDVQRDWGYAGDYVEAMWSILQLDKPDDFVIATGVPHSVREFISVAMRILDLKGELADYVKHDSTLIRPSEIFQTLGNSQKAKETFGWQPKTSFEAMIEKMLENDLRITHQEFRSQ